MASVELPASLNIGPFDFEVEVRAHYEVVDEQGNIELGEVHLRGEPLILTDDERDQVKDELQELIS